MRVNNTMHACLILMLKGLRPDLSIDMTGILMKLNGRVAFGRYDCYFYAKYENTIFNILSKNGIKNYKSVLA